MSKRKRDEVSGSEAPYDSAAARTLRLQRLQVDSLLQQSTTSLFRSLKVARGFERQKLGRRQKSAAQTEHQTPDVGARLEAEIAALKSLDLASTAEQHLYRSLLKTKLVASAPALPRYVQATVDGSKKPQETAGANVQARLFKSGPVQAAMAKALKDVWAGLGIEEPKSNGKKRMRAKDYADGSLEDDVDGPEVSKRGGSLKPLTGAQEQDEWSGLSAHESLADDEHQELQKKEEDMEENDNNDDDEDVDYDMYTSRLAGSSGSDSESIGVEAEGQDHDRDAMSITEDETEGHEEAEDNNDRPSNNPLRKPKPPTRPPKSTTFLPSLSMGGYWSGSDSDPPSSSGGGAANGVVRKNRMGQQARRALWEKKFGKEARHVKKGARDRDRDRDQGWDARKGAQGGGDGRGKRGRGRGRAAGRGGGRGGARFARSTGANADPVVARKAKPSTAAANVPLHPSWEAARKAKEQKKATPFQGKKVVFD